VTALVWKLRQASVHQTDRPYNDGLVKDAPYRVHIQQPTSSSFTGSRRRRNNAKIHELRRKLTSILEAGPSNDMMHGCWPNVNPISSCLRNRIWSLSNHGQITLGYLNSSKSTSSRELTVLQMISHSSDLIPLNRPVLIDPPKSMQGETEEQLSSFGSIDTFSCKHK
jgi:hypothetical protein